MERYHIDSLVVIGAREPFRETERPRLVRPVLENPGTQFVSYLFREEDGWVEFIPRGSGPRAHFDCRVREGALFAFDSPFPAKSDHVLYVGPGLDTYIYVPRHEGMRLLEEFPPDHVSEETKKIAAGS